MRNKASDKITEALAQLMEGLTELDEEVKSQHNMDPETEELEDPDIAAEIEAEIITEVRAAVETLMDTDDYSSEEIANLVTSLREALQEIDPSVFDTLSDSDEDDDDDYGYEEDSLDDLDDEELDDDELDDDEQDD